MEHSDRLMYTKCFFFFLFVTQAPLDLRRITINLFLLQNHEEYVQQSQKYVTVNTMRIILNPCLTNVPCVKLVHIKEQMLLIWLHNEYILITNDFHHKLKTRDLRAQAVAAVFLPSRYQKLLTWRETWKNTNKKWARRGGCVESHVAVKCFLYFMSEIDECMQTLFC